MKNQNESRLNGFLELAKAGMPLFPLSSGKTPAIKKWEAEATTDPDRITHWFRSRGGCNFGLAVGRAGLVAVDCDLKGGKNGERTLAEAGAVPRTLKVRTPSGGCHYYFSAKETGSRNGALEGVDIKSCGGYVVAPGSITGAGAYVVEQDLPVAELPGWIAEVCKAAGAPRQKSPLREDIEPDTEDKVAMAEEIIEQWEYADKGGRNDSLYRLACELCKAGVSPEKALELYIEFGEEKIGLPADSPEVGRTIRSGYAEGSVFGEYSAEARQNAVGMFGELDEGEAEEKERPKWRKTMREIMGAAPATDRWYIDNWLSAKPGNLTLFSGRGGTGKSMLMLELSAALVSGGSFLGMRVNHKAKTIYISCEDDLDAIADRARMLKPRELNTDDIEVWDRRGTDNLLCLTAKDGSLTATNFALEVIANARDFFGEEGGLIIFDTLSDVFPGNENDRSVVSRFVKHIISRILQETNSSGIILAHQAKGAIVAGQGFSGSTAWEGAVRTRWELNFKNPEDPRSLVELKLAKLNHAAAPARSTITFAKTQNGIEVVSEALADAKLADVVENVIRDGVDADAPYNKSNTSDSAIWKAGIQDPFTGADLTEQHIRQLVKGLEEEGRVVTYRSKRRNYLIPTSHPRWVERQNRRGE